MADEGAEEGPHCLELGSVVIIQQFCLRYILRYIFLLSFCYLNLGTVPKYVCT